MPNIDNIGGLIENAIGAAKEQERWYRRSEARQSPEFARAGQQLDAAVAALRQAFEQAQEATTKLGW